MRRNRHLRVAAPASQADTLSFWRNEAQRWKVACREAAARADVERRSRIILWRAWEAATKGEQESILKLASQMSEDDFMTWLADLTANS